MKQLKIKEKKKRGFLGMLPAVLGASLLGNLLVGKGVVRAGDGVIRTDGGVISLGEGQGLKCHLIF